MQYQTLLLAALAAYSTATPPPPAPMTLEGTYETFTRDLQALSENIAITGKSDRSAGSWKLASRALGYYSFAAGASTQHDCPANAIKPVTTAKQAEEYVDDVQSEAACAYEKAMQKESTMSEFCALDAYFEAVGVFTGAVTS